jgi:hypothetical protein
MYITTHGPLNVKLKKDVAVFILLIVTGSVDVKETSSLTSFLIYDTITENRLRLTPAQTERPESRFISRIFSYGFCEATRNVWNCRMPESQGARTPAKNCTNKGACYCEWFRQLIWSAADFLGQVCLKQCVYEQTSHPATTSTKTERCMLYTSQKTHRGVSANMTRRLNLFYVELRRFHPTMIVSVNTYSDVACPHNMLICSELQMAIG